VWPLDAGLRRYTLAWVNQLAGAVPVLLISLARAERVLELFGLLSPSTARMGVAGWLRGGPAGSKGLSENSWRRGAKRKGRPGPGVPPFAVHGSLCRQGPERARVRLGLAVPFCGAPGRPALPLILKLDT